MADFFQNGIITTFQELGSRDCGRFETELNVYAAQRPLALVLPCLYSELEGPALGPILDELSQVGYVREVVVSLGMADARSSSTRSSTSPAFRKGCAFSGTTAPVSRGSRPRCTRAGSIWGSRERGSRLDGLRLRARTIRR